jgi:hypothetical protein
MPQQPKYTVHVYAPDNTFLRVLDFVQSARYRCAENEVGDFDVTVPYGNGHLPSLLVPPNRVEFYRDADYVFGGIILRQEINQEGRQPFYTCSGPSYMVWLSDAEVTSTTGTGDVTSPSDNLDDVMKWFVRNHVLDTNTNFVCAADSGLSAVTDTYASTGYSSVLEALQNIATRAGDTLFDIIRDTDKVLRFRTWTPSRGPDKSIGASSPVLFDMTGGNIQKANWIRDGNKVVNAVRGGGPGDKAARYIYPAAGYLLDSASILDWGRKEGFYDAGSETTGNTDKKTQDSLKKTAVPEESVSFTVSEFGRYTLGNPSIARNFDYETKVTVTWGNILTFTDVIRGIEVKLDEGSNVASVDINVGDTLTGDSDTRSSIILGRYLRDLSKSLNIAGTH